MEREITIYTTTMCPACGMIREFLTNMNLDYKEVNLDFKPLEMIRLIGKTRRLAVPQTNVNGEWVFGFDPVRMLELLNSKVN